MELTQKQLKEKLTYNKKTGLFRHKKLKDRNKSQIAGCIEHQGYIRIQIDNKSYKAHRLAWLYMHGELPILSIDHINGIKHDNRAKNLRHVSQKVNSRNSKLNSLNTSGYTGVTWDKSRQKWISQIKIDCKNIHLGRFNEKEEAIQARLAANKEYGFHDNHGRDENTKKFREEYPYDEQKK